MPKKLISKLDSRAKDKTLRALAAPNNLVDFSSNDYLGFAQNESLFSKIFQVVLHENISQNGATGSRLISGNHKLYPILETYLAKFHETEAALVFNSGYDANIGFFSAAPQRGDFVFYDEYIHASIRDGIGMGHAKGYKFKHNDLNDLKGVIENLKLNTSEHAGVDVYVVTESVFSMDGDTPDLKVFAKFCNENGYHLIVDEAHAVGVMGENGEGLVQDLGLQDQVFARMVTFGKAIGVHGAAVLGSTGLKEYLVNFSRSFIYSTGLSPHAVASILASYEFLNADGKEGRTELAEKLSYFKEQLKKYKLNSHFIVSNSAIQSCIVPGVKKVKTVSEKLQNDGFNVKAILSPTVPEGQERLRFCLHSYNSKEEIGLVLKLLSGYL
ncbi:MAG: pyridoxal phosphate-dependent aminotransferase family protein [Maribacter sp.]